VLLSAFLRPVFAWQRRRGRSLDIPEGETGAVTFFQRFGGALNLHPHFHRLIPDGLFVPAPGREELEFVSLPPPSAEELASLTEMIARRITKRVRRRVDAADREGLERLCRYGLRAPFSQERFSLAEDGRVVYQLPRPWPNSAGVTHLELEGTELLSRQAALAPAPYLNMTRYHGVFSSRSKWRSSLPAPAERWAAGDTPADLGAESAASAAAGAVPRAEESPDCVRCGGKRKVLAFLTDPEVVTKILRHVGVETRPLPLAPARVRVRVREMELELWELETGSADWSDAEGASVRGESWDGASIGVDSGRGVRRERDGQGHWEMQIGGERSEKGPEGARAEPCSAMTFSGE